SRIDLTSRSECPVIDAIWASVHPARARRVTAVPRRSLNVTPPMPAFLQAFRHDERKPSGVQGLSSLLTKMSMLRFGVASSAAFSGLPTGIDTRAPVLDWRSVILLPS